MIRDLQRLASESFDVAVIGGGIYGACIAWEAALRGLSVALLEKSDFASATSANSLKIIHGGFRYLQHADLRRMRESVVERGSLLRIAPHLIHPLPVLIPTYGHGMKGKEILALGLLAYEAISWDRNRLKDPQKHIPQGRTVSKTEIVEKLPGINRNGLTGGVIFYDAQVYNSERLVLEYLHSASEAGAAIANYAEVTGFIRKNDRVHGVEALDVLSGEAFQVRAKMVINASGPWSDQMLERLHGRGRPPLKYLTKAINIITRQLFDQYAVGLLGQNNLQDSGALVKKGSSFLFVTPWRNHSITGTTYVPYSDDPNRFRLKAEDVSNIITEINRAYPAAALSVEDVTFVHAGLLPADRIDEKTGGVDISRHYEIFDSRTEGVSGLMTVVGVKYTTARDVAVRTIDRVFAAWGKPPPASKSATTALYGGRIERFGDYLQSEIKNRPCGLGRETVERLVYNYGSAYYEVLAHFEQKPDRSHYLTEEEAVLRAETLHGVRREMARKVADIVLRRTALGTAGHPGHSAVRLCAEVMGSELGWDRAKINREVQEVDEIYDFTHS